MKPIIFVFAVALFLIGCSSCPPCPEKPDPYDFGPCLSLVGSLNQAYGKQARELDSLKRLIETGALVPAK